MSKDYICELCGNVYARSTGLKQHMMSQHSEQVTIAPKSHEFPIEVVQSLI